MVNDKQFSSSQQLFTIAQEKKLQKTDDDKGTKNRAMHF